MSHVIRKTYQSSETKEAQSAERTLIVKISTNSPDRSNDVVIPAGVVLDNYLRNPVVAFGHNYSGLSVAKTQEITVTDDGILAKVVFPKEGVYELADTLYELYKDGFMNAWSIGFMPMEYKDRESGGREFTKWELLEYSAVLVPDNPQALTVLRSKGISVEGEDNKELIDSITELKTAVEQLTLSLQQPKPQELELTDALALTSKVLEQTFNKYHQSST